MKESKAYKTYLGYATGTVPPKVVRKFKKASPYKKDSMPIPANEEPSKRKEKVDVARGKGIDLLSEVALTEEAQMKEEVSRKIIVKNINRILSKTQMEANQISNLINKMMMMKLKMMMMKLKMIMMMISLKVIKMDEWTAMMFKIKRQMLE
uniref:Uncharacterized protein n=1 Tax=Tanacetum cinerariifolium TaxID=118510 RepID=A0A699KGY2_TANCI|nr:hypothetical protein [Tanacetum cinerariifolium]